MTSGKSLFSAQLPNKWKNLQMELVKEPQIRKGRSEYYECRWVL